MNSIILITALFSPTLVCLTSKIVSIKKQQALYFILLVMSLLSWVVLFFKNPNASGMLFNSPMILDIFGKQFFCNFLLNSTSLFFLSIILLQIILLVCLNYLDNDKEKYNIWDYLPLQTPLCFTMILSNSIFIVYLSFLVITYLNLYLDLTSKNVKLRARAPLVFVGQSVLDVSFLLTCFIVVSNANVPAELFNTNSDYLLYGNKLELVLIGILVFKAFWMILENVFFVSTKSVSKILVETSFGLIILSFIVFRFALQAAELAILQDYIWWALVPIAMYCGYYLICQTFIRQFIVSLSMMFCSYIAIMGIVVGPSIIIHMTLVYLVVMNAVYIYYRTGKFSEKMDKGNFSSDIWNKTYWVILLVPLAMFPGGYLYWPMRELLWVLAQEQRILEFVLIVVLTGSLVWFLSKIFFQQFGKEALAKSNKALLFFKIFVTFFLVITLVLSLSFAPENAGFFSRRWLGFLEIHQSLASLKTISVNIWFSLIWSVLFILEIAGLYILYITSTSGKNLDNKYQQINELVIKRGIDLWNETRKIIKIFLSALSKLYLLLYEYGYKNKTGLRRLLPIIHFWGGEKIKYLEFKSMQSKIDSFLWILIVLVFMYSTMR